MKLALLISLALPLSLSAYAVREWWTLRDVDAAAERAGAAAANRRQAIETLCREDGGRPIAGERLVYCERVRCEPGMALRLWERSYR